MQFENILAVSLLLVLVAISIWFKTYKAKKNNQSVSLDTIVDIYVPQLIEVLKDSIRIITMSVDKYSTREEYEKAIIDATIYSIRKSYSQSCEKLNLLFENLDDGTLVSIIYDVLHKNYKQAFDILGGEIIENHINLYDKESLL